MAESFAVMMANESMRIYLQHAQWIESLKVYIFIFKWFEKGFLSNALLTELVNSGTRRILSDRSELGEMQTHEKLLRFWPQFSSFL